jgi:hypothetical protein
MWLARRRICGAYGPFLVDAGSWLAQVPTVLVKVGILLLLLYALRDRTQGVSKAAAL